MKTKDILLAREALERLDFDAIRRVAHDLKGEGASYGFNDVTVLGGALEEAALCRDSITASDLITKLSAFIDQIEIIFSSCP